MTTQPPPSASQGLERIAAKSVATPPHGCVLWVGAVGDDGYGRMVVTANGAERTVRPHRYAYELQHGALPAGRVPMHSCDETLCVALDHLSDGTQRTNLAQMAARGRSAGRYHSGLGDARGPAGRARAIRDALAAGWDSEAFTRAVLAGDVRRLVREALLRGYDPDTYVAAVIESDPSRAQLTLPLI